MSIGMEKPISTILLQELHRDKRTGKLPVGVLSGQDQFERAKEIAAGDPLAEPFPEPKNVAGMKILVERLLNRAGTGAVLPEERRHQAAKAMAYLAALSGEISNRSTTCVARSRPCRSALLRTDAHAARDQSCCPRWAPRAASGARRFGQPHGTADSTARRAAVAAFGQSVSRYGIRLTREEIKRQYDRYNQERIGRSPTRNRCWPTSWIGSKHRRKRDDNDKR